MPDYFALFLLAFAVSLDSFGVGITYGLRKMKLPFTSLLFITGCSATAVIIAMWLGSGIGRLLPQGIAETSGGIILISIGLFALYQVYRKPLPARSLEFSEKVLINMELKRLGIVIHVLKKPMEADLDDSGTIKGTEAVLLGVALSLDAFGAGFGAALLGASPWLLALSVACMCGIFLTAGKVCGGWLIQSEKLQRLSFLPGFMLILLGIWQL